MTRTQWVHVLLRLIGPIVTLPAIVAAGAFAMWDSSVLKDIGLAFRLGLLTGVFCGE